MIPLDQLRAAARARCDAGLAETMAWVQQQLDAADAPLEWAGIVYESLLAPDDRRAGGSHYTPAELADEIGRAHV